MTVAQNNSKCTLNHTTNTNGLQGIVPERSAPTGVSVLIVGAGVAGLMASLECWRKGQELNKVPGDSFTIGPTAIRAVQQWPDMAVENEKIADSPWISWHKLNGEKISGPEPLRFNPTVSSSGKDEAPQRVYRHSRPAFHKMLSDQAERIGIFVEYGKRVTGYYESGDKAGVTLKDGEKIESDLVISSDGVGSKSSMVTMGREMRARSSGLAMYRAAYPVELAMVDPMVQERFQLLEDGTSVGELWMGTGMHVLFARSEDTMTWAMTYADNRDETESWSKLTDPETVLKVTATIPGWPEVANRVIKRTPLDRLHDFKLMWREPQPCWVSPNGRVVQIGDAAHTFLPSSGSGATQAMEDAVSIATCLGIAGKDNVTWASKVHNKLRFERVACLQKLGIFNQESRHRSVNSGNLSQSKSKGLLAAWIWRHDPERYAVENYVKVLAHLVDGMPFSNTNTPPGHVYKPWTIDELLSAKERGEEIELDGDWD
ncbi:hypothetical protein PENANT_c021G02786 [Penicillium antarcticum]|uniref:FAD-binding domain-containing protein n=1 Tax=Penicillium antarcticum TaxID=416450 RepID=A0A1V6Q038_9EURO|nr:uncharacterized protein N7508_010920 [Penicillium antarcticum]KAJ5296099.1 hypothetical protein N7508_010920 [Penicillium antarcticum]OQD82575.1 hypothetical protein PENANT_c021G02786 [Penicillium antarcticum]